MYPCRQPSAADPAMVKGKRRRTSPAARRKVPSTEQRGCLSVSSRLTDRRGELTIELDDVEPDTLHHSPLAADSTLQKTFFLRQGSVVAQKYEHRRRNDRQDDCKAAVRPSPVRFMESFCGFRTCECRDNIWRRCKSVCEASVAECRCVGCNDIDAEYDPSEADGVEDLAKIQNQHCCAERRMTSTNSPELRSSSLYHSMLPRE